MEMSNSHQIWLLWESNQLTDAKEIFKLYSMAQLLGINMI